MTNYHLVVLVHGLWGNASHFDYITKALTTYAKDHDDKDEKEQLLVYTTTLNEGFKTYDGIDVCGFRVAQEIADQIDCFESSNLPDKIVKFSMVGYSLGGLISRYALGLLYKRQYFKKREIQLMNFTTFCTPHVGVLAPGRNVAVKLFNSTVPWLLGNSGKQMFLKDSISSHGLDDSNEGLPLIYLMSLEKSVFYRALESFKYKSLYANIINDKRTAWWTSGISLNDPFFNIDEYNGVKVFQYIPGFDTVVIDRNKMIVISKVAPDGRREDTSSKTVKVNFKTENDEEDFERNAGQDYYFFNYWFAKIGKWILVILNLLIIAPLLLLWKIVQSAAEMTISTIRVTRFVNKYSHQLMHDFFDISALPVSESDDLISSSDTDSSVADFEREDEICPLRSTLSKASSILSASNSGNISPVEYGGYLGLEESLNDQADYLMESIYDAIERKNTHAGFVEEAPPNSGNIDKKSLAVTIREVENQSVEQLIAKHGKNMQTVINNLHLDLPTQQVAIIKSLNKLNWEKFPIYIRKTSSTHACAIVRQADVDFHEGQVVVDHWIQKVFRRE